MRINVIDAMGTVSFVAPCHAIKVLTAACSKNPQTLAELLANTERYDPQLSRFLLDGLSVFDEHNTPVNAESIHTALQTVAPKQAPPFRVVDDFTREVSLLPVGAGLVLFNLLAKRIIQVQNAYSAIQRQDRGRIRENGQPTSRLYRYKLPEAWQVLP